MMLSTKYLTDFPKWIRFQSDFLVEVSLGDEERTGCPIWLTLPVMGDTDDKRIFGFGQIKSQEFVKKLQENKFFRNITSRWKFMENKREGMYFKLRGQYPALDTEFYIKGPMGNGARVTFSRYPTQQNGLTINLDDKLTACL